MNEKKPEWEIEEKHVAIIREKASKMKTPEEMIELCEEYPRIYLRRIEEILDAKTIKKMIRLLAESIELQPYRVEIYNCFFCDDMFNIVKARSGIRKAMTVYREESENLLALDRHLKRFKEKIFGTGLYVINGREINVTKEDIDRGIKILESEGRYVCARTLRDVCLLS